MNLFQNFGSQSGTDKITHHGYHRFYPKYLDPIRHTVNSMLEIGIEQKKSLPLWLNYFPNASIYGIDINFEYITDRVQIFKADQSSLKDLEKVVNSIQQKNVDFIIDDGSHIPEHQWLTFNYLFSELLKEGGIYIIEDIETSYWKNGGLYGYQTRYGLNHPKSFIEKSKLIIDTINKEFLNNEDKEKVQLQTGLSYKTLDSISTITYGQNCIIICKKTQDEIKYNNRLYRFQDKIQ